MHSYGIKVKYIYSACVVTKTADVTILHDPWFTDGIYDGTWFVYPEVNDPLALIGDVDYVYISHIHPDHYDPIFLRKYFTVYGLKKIIIADRQNNYLALKMRADGFNPIILSEPIIIGNTTIEIIPHEVGSKSDVDSLSIIKYATNIKNHCVVNGNDVVFDDQILRKVKEAAPNGVDIFLCSFTGAGSYPASYFDIDDPSLINAAYEKKNLFFNRYKYRTQQINAKVNIPFAGKYILGGRGAKVFKFSGIADAVDVLEFDKKAIVLSDEGGEINTDTLTPSSIRTKRYSEKLLDEKLQELSLKKLDYERLIDEKQISNLPIKRLLSIAIKNAIKLSECDTNYYFCILLHNGEYAVINALRDNKEGVNFCKNKGDLPEPRSEIYIDQRYLFGLLTHLYHWNNAQGGCAYDTRRVPNVYNKSAQNFLNFLAV
jgi:UDP-MurNAc hydroxylase